MSLLDTQSIPKSVAFYVYKKGTTEAAELEMRVVDAHGTESWQKVAQQPITLGGFTETERSQSIVVRLDPGAYTVVESTDESAGYWFAKSAAYLRWKPGDAGLQRHDRRERPDHQQPGRDRHALQRDGRSAPDEG